MAIWTAPPIWENGEAWIIGGGTSVPRQFGVPEDVVQSVMRGGPASAYSPYLAPLHDRHVIGVNNAYKIGNWIDVIFFGDCGWYVQHKNYLYALNCLKVTCCDRFAKPDKFCEGIKYLAKDRKKPLGLTDNTSMISWNFNSGAAAINVAVHFGVKRIILLGFDMTLDDKKVSHWHGSHSVTPVTKPGKIRVPPFARHLKGFAAIADDAARLGIEILNGSPISTIPQFPKINVRDLLNQERPNSNLAIA